MAIMKTTAWALLAIIGLVSRTEAVPAFKCPSDGIFEHPEDCLSYYHCKGGEATVETCSKPLHFNPVKNTCDWGIAEKCFKGEYSSAYYAPEAKGPTPPIPAGSWCPAVPCPCPKPIRCHCEWYISCDSGWPVARKCSDGLYFNPETEVCDLPENVDCDLRYCVTTTPPTTTTTTEATTCPPETCTCEDDRTPVGTDCRCYEERKYCEIRTICCPPGLLFNPITKVCDCNYECPKDPTCPCDCCFVPDDCDCAAYWRCFKGHLTKEKCSDGLYFDPISETCNWKHNVNRTCPPRPTFPTTTTLRPTTTTTTTAGLPGVCSGGKEFYPHPDCTKFIHCSHGIGYVKDCPKPLHWSIAADRCEWPCIAKCDPSVKPC